jgi:hypothetical protein
MRGKKIKNAVIIVVASVVPFALVSLVVYCGIKKLRKIKNNERGSLHNRIGRKD